MTTAQPATLGLPATAWRRWALWLSFSALLAGLLVTAMALALRLQEHQAQQQLALQAARLADELRSGLVRNVKTLQALAFQVHSAEAWQAPALELLENNPEMLRLERRDHGLNTLLTRSSPYADPALVLPSDPARMAQLQVACDQARRTHLPTYTSGYAWARAGDEPLPTIDKCLPKIIRGELVGFLTVAYSLPGMLTELTSAAALDGIRTSLYDPETQRDLAQTALRPTSGLVAEHMLELTGHLLVLRLETPRSHWWVVSGDVPRLVLGLSLLLVLATGLLARDMVLRQRAEAASRASQEQLQAASRLASVGEMATLLSHELNQPLSAIASYATGSLNLLAQPGARPDELVKDLATAMAHIQAQTERAGRVIRSVGNFVRRRERSGALVREQVPLQQLLHTVLPLVQLQAQRDGTRVVTDIDPACPDLLCDRTMVEQVLLNLCRNGLQAMADPGPAGEAATPAGARVLTLSATPLPRSAGTSAAWLAIAVTDQGHGLSDAVARQLFAPFFSTREQGMGLGLSLCRTVVEQHGGTLSHSSARPRGTEFRLTLPTASASTAAQPAPAA
jgi:signal transduction histidine kinase